MGYPSTVDTGQTTPQLISDEPASIVSTSITLSASGVYLYAFEVQVQTTVIAAYWGMGATATGKTNMGIYIATYTGNQISGGSLVSGSDTGQITNVANTDNNFTYTVPVILGPGQYFMALAPSNATDTYLGRSAAAGFTEARARKATNALSGTALPATTGTLITTTAGISCALKTLGGLP